MRRALVAALLLVTGTVSIGAAVVAGRRVTLISDIHYDPLYGKHHAYKCTKKSSPVWGTPGCDSSPQLTARALEDVSAHNTSLVLYSGDWQRHHYSRSGLEPATLFKDLSQRFRNITVDGSLGAIAFSASLGNNDVVPDYYFALEDAATNEQLSYRVDAMLEEGLLSPAEAAVIRKCGYYTHELAHVHVIVLHTLLWAYRLEPELPSSVDDPCGQFSFLKSELQRVRAAGKRAIVMGHIPPGLNAYGVLDHGFRSAVEDMFWKEAYEATYDSIIHDFRDLVAVQLFGHTHKFTLLTLPRNGALSIIVPAVSPIFSNNPSYLVAEFSDAWAMEDAVIRYTTSDGVFHSGLTTTAALNLPSGGLQSVSDVRAAITRLATNDTTWERFLTIFCGGEKRLGVFPKATCDDNCRYVVVCSMLENNHSEIQRCVANYTARTPPSSEDARTSGGMIAAVLIFSFLVIGAGAVLLLMSRSGQTTISWENVSSLVWWRSLLERQKRSGTVTVSDDAEAGEREGNS
ncbi:hypothetical protein NESM_000524400 [Novymonas esmeraldas]|uniref:Calcineurin-like phosphoesterase domain-containing protein n=1 Tax=Novymonas esmeraldas TaxID=1808958 RepID=A0AAW0EQI4_9TRYP